MPQHPTCPSRSSWLDASEMSSPQAPRRRWLIRSAVLALSGWWHEPGAAGPSGRSATSAVGDIPIELARDLGPEAVATVDLSRYLVSEKLDGVRAIWTGRRWLTRSGREIPAPPRWLASLPAGEPLDGELWLGRGRFEAVSGLLHRLDATDDPLWSTLRYAVFDLPGATGTFAQRQLRLKALLADRPAVGDVRIEAIEQRRVASPEALRRWLDEVVAQDGEGLVLHATDAAFRPGRSAGAGTDAAGHLLKLKPLSDAEAVVIGHLPGKGRHLGRVGALQVRDAQGRRFAVGSGLSDAQRESPPAIGQRISYRHRGVTRHGLPRFATFWRVLAED
ncbi:DNA ligase [Leptothrix discophora]|uniref:DNA ligase n=1 Tax=Leptothrix discophora TaxID=89 RepID=A0ABT9FY47_LEPDI|nr:DNA ligase [Leptothrix discophora]MDP4299155.1 DNA ligase [Leptothrix discophora]